MTLCYSRVGKKNIYREVLEHTQTHFMSVHPPSPLNSSNLRDSYKKLDKAREAKDIVDDVCRLIVVGIRTHTFAHTWKLRKYALKYLSVVYVHSRCTHVQGGQKIVIQYTIYYTLYAVYTYFWPTLF